MEITNPSLPAWLTLVILLVSLWTIPWKGVALWKAARRGNTIWFVVLLVVNTAAILEIIYIFFLARESGKLPEQKIN